MVVYEQANTAVVTAIDAATGTRRWATTLSPLPVGSGLASVTITPAVIVVSSDASLQAFYGTGRPRFAIGS